MELIDTWFDFNKEKTDYDNVTEFVQSLPEKLQIIFKEPSSNFQEIYLVKNDIPKEIFNAAFYEAKVNLSKGLDILNTEDLKENAKSHRLKRRRDSNKETLEQIGFTGDSLKLKATVLNKLWLKIINSVNKFGGGVIDFSKNEIVQLVRKFLTYLNSILGSLTVIIPRIEGIKEFKEVVESILDLGETL